MPSPLLSADEAVALVRKCNRGAAALSYGWLSSEHPDPLGHRVGELRTALISLTNIAGFFWDFASLPQNPRTAEEDEAFCRVVVMGDLYSSPCGLSVLQIRHIPPRPLDFELVIHHVVTSAGIHEGAVATARSFLQCLVVRSAPCFVFLCLGFFDAAFAGIFEQLFSRIFW